MVLRIFRGKICSWLARRATPGSGIASRSPLYTTIKPASTLPLSTCCAAGIHHDIIGLRTRRSSAMDRSSPRTEQADGIEGRQSICSVCGECHNLRPKNVCPKAATMSQISPVGLLVLSRNNHLPSLQIILQWLDDASVHRFSKALVCEIGSRSERAVKAPSDNICYFHPTFSEYF